jgi:hypothetical protein
MPNDAKLGLLTGVIGVIVVAAMSGKTPAALKPAGGPAANTPSVQSVVKPTGTAN